MPDTKTTSPKATDIQSMLPKEGETWLALADNPAFPTPVTVKGILFLVGNATLPHLLLDHDGTPWATDINGLMSRYKRA